MTSATGSPAHSATAASSVRSMPAAAAAAWAARISAKRKPCGVCARQSCGAVERGGNAPVGARPASAYRPAAWRRWRRARGRGPRARASMISAVTNGRTASWISTRSGACAFSASRPLRTEACRVAPAVDGWEKLCAIQSVHRRGVAVGIARRRSPPGRRRCRGAPGTRASVRASTVVAADASVLLGQRGGGPRAAAAGNDQGGGLQLPGPSHRL